MALPMTGSVGVCSNGLTIAAIGTLPSHTIQDYQGIFKKKSLTFRVAEKIIFRPVTNHIESVFHCSFWYSCTKNQPNLHSGCVSGSCLLVCHIFGLSVSDASVPFPLHPAPPCCKLTSSLPNVLGGHTYCCISGSDCAKKR